MSIDAALLAAATFQGNGATPISACSSHDVTKQLSLASVLLDGGYDGVATLAEALAGGDLGIGTVDKLDGELVVVDGQPWRVNDQGVAELMPPSTRTPFTIVSSLTEPQSLRLRDASLDSLTAAISSLVNTQDQVVAVRLEGQFRDVVMRSVSAQTPPYRPFAEIVGTDEVRWYHPKFFGVMVGFSFPNIEHPGATIPGLHLHGVDRLRTTGGHNYELEIVDATLTVSVCRELVFQLPDRSMADLLLTPAPMRAVQRALLRNGPASVSELAVRLDTSETEMQHRITWLVDRGFISHEELADATVLWHPSLRTPAARISDQVAAVLDSL